MPDLAHEKPLRAGGRVRTTPPRAVIFTTALLIGAISGALAQEDAPPPEEPEKATSSPGQGVYLNDSFEAADALRRARELARNHDWLEAARLLQQTAEEFGDRLVRIDEGYYVGIRAHVNHRIAAWPSEGLQAYRSLYESKAEGYASLAQADRNIDALLPIFERFFCTQTAGRLADTIGQLAIESGNLALAYYVYRRAATKHPDAREHGPHWNAMRTLVATMTGQPEEDRDVPEPVAIRWKGKDRSLADVLEEARESFAAVRQPPSPFDWAIFGGNEARNRIPSLRVEELGVLWRYAYGAGNKEPDGTEPGALGDLEAEDGGRLIVQPVVTNGLVIVQHHRAVVTLRRNTGEVAWKFRADASVDERLDYLEDRAPGWDAPTVHDGRVYASLPGDAVPYFSYGSARLPFELVCLDLETGRVHWRVSQRMFETRFAEVHFDSSPIVHYDRVYLVGRRRRSFGFEDCYLYRFDARDGTLQHRTHLGSASTGSFGSRPATRTVAALHGDTVFVCTNLGSIAAVSAHTGDVQWLRLYDRHTPAEGLRASRFAAQVDAWRFNPLIWADGRLAALPTDASALLVLDARDGQLLARISTERLGGVAQLLGLRSDLVCGLGAEAFCYDIAKNKPRWSTPLPENASLFGRGLWARDAVLAPTQDALVAFDAETGAQRTATWREGCGGGNLLALPDQLLVAGAQRLCAYVRKAELWAALKARIDESPDDPLPALELAEIALRSEEHADALNALNEGARRLDRASAAPDAPARRRLFQDAVTFAETLAQRSALDAETLDRLFTFAAANAADTDAHLEYRIRFAELYDKRERPQKAIQLYQQILRDRTLRSATVEAQVDRKTAAARLVTDRIAALIERNGRTIYEPYEREAAQWLSGAVAEGDEQTLQRIIDTFPNSRAAPKALIRCGDLLASKGQVTEAARRWTAACHRYPGQVKRPDLLKRIADAYESSGREAQAYRWLTKAAREYPMQRIEHAGRKVTFREYRDRLEGARSQVEPSRPRIRLPLQQGVARSFTDRTALLVPKFGHDPANRWSVAYIHAADGILAVDPRTTENRWPEPAQVRMPAELLLSTNAQAVFATPYEVFALDAGTGSRMWSRALYPEHLDDFAGDWETGEAFRNHALSHARLLSVRDNGDMQYVRLDSGKLLWTRRHRPAPWGVIALGEGWAAYHIVQDGHVVLLLVDLATGDLLNAITTDQKRPVENLHATLDHQLLLVTSESVEAYDAATGSRRWHVESHGHIRQASLLPDLEALYFSEDGFDLVKIGLEDGERVWETNDLLRERAEDMTLQRASDSLIVSSSSGIAAVDPMSGLVLWRGTTPPNPRFVSRLITERHVLTVNLPAKKEEHDNTALFYEHYNASGLIPDGGMVKLGDLEDVRGILALDNALLIQDDNVIQGWTSE